MGGQENFSPRPQNPGTTRPAAAPTLPACPEGQGHGFREGFFRCQELVDFLIARAQAGR